MTSWLEVLAFDKIIASSPPIVGMDETECYLMQLPIDMIRIIAMSIPSLEAKKNCRLVNRRLCRLLDEMLLLGIRTNIAALEQKLVEHPKACMLKITGAMLKGEGVSLLLSLGWVAVPRRAIPDT